MPAEIYQLFSSSKGNCCLIKNGDDVFLIDAGVSAKRIEAAVKQVGIAPEQIRAVFVTHEHSDHIKGLDTLSRRYGMEIYAPTGCFDGILSAAPDAFPFLKPNEPGTLTCLENTRIYTVRTPHDACASVGFRIELAGEIMAYFTDIGHLSSEILRAMSGCKRVVIESNHDVERLKAGPYPFPLKKRILGPYGHLSNFDCAALLPHLVRYGTQRIVLAHLSEENNTPEMAYEESARRLDGAASLAVAKPAETVEV